MSTVGGAGATRGPLHRFFATDHRRLNELLRLALEGDGPLDLASFRAFRAGILRHIGMEEKEVRLVGFEAPPRPPPFEGSALELHLL